MRHLLISLLILFYCDAKLDAEEPGPRPAQAVRMDLSAMVPDSEKAHKRLDALVALLTEQAGDAMQGRGTAATVLSTLRGRAPDIGATVGYPILDSQGRLSDPVRVLIELRQRLIARQGIHGAHQAFKRLFGNEPGEAIFHADLSQVDRMAAPR